MPYSYFKNIIYEIYRFRLSLAEELASNLLDHYIVMDEFICIYFLEVPPISNSRPINYDAWLKSSC